MKEASVAITKCQSYNFDELYSAIAKVAEAASMPSVEGKTILLKPNILSDAKPEDCITTNPEFVRAVIRLLKAQGALEIYVGDSPGLQSASFEGKRCGINAVCLEEGAKWVDFTKDPVKKHIVGTTRSLYMASIIDKVDMVFSLAKFKTHQLMYTTGAVKNLFGTIPGLHKSTCHIKCPNRESFARLIVGIHETVKPAFAFMDAVIGMEGAGPANGDARPLGLVMASSSCLAMDYAQGLIMGYDPKVLPILQEASRRHILPTNIEYPLLKAQDVVVPDFVRIPICEKTHFVKSLIVPFFTRGIQKKMQRQEPRPLFNDASCIRCARCVNICPAKALSLQLMEKTEASNFTTHVVADYSKCIRCYCCHEMCPADAITIEKRTL
jgi:uncharacterized protein (DUF362 family)/Pyruvate/2-oxoacid:ferredoxin oxidoreductase delta subunit